MVEFNHRVARKVQTAELCPQPTATARESFRRFASRASAASGSHIAFIAAVGILLLWACSYPLFLWAKDPFNTWQLVINTLTTIVTFLMVFLIQNTQNRDARTLQLKLDELIRAVTGAHNRLVELENCTDEELEQLKKEFEHIRQRATDDRNQSRDDSTIRTEPSDSQSR